MDPFGAPFCRPGCCVARLGQSERAPQTFSLCTVDAEGEKLPLSVSIILVPSQQSDVWISVHLLRRDPAVDPLEAIDWPVRNKQGSAAKRPGCRGARDALAPLSKREQEIVELLAEGLSTSAIAELLAIRPVTVRNHIQHIQQKLGVHSKLEAVAYMYRHNLLRTRVPKSTRTA
jgi:DNA-binding CsgD family transcriptional regulator